MNFSSSPILSTGRVLLRPFSQSDIADYLLLRNDERVNQYLERVKILSEEEALAFINRINNNIAAGKAFYRALCLKGQDKLIGTVCLWNFSEDRKSGELGYELSPDYQGKGIMNEAIRQLIDFALTELQLNCLEAWVHKDNAASTRLLLKHDFVLETGHSDKENPDYIAYKLSKNYIWA